MSVRNSKYQKLFEKESAHLKHTEEFLNSNNGIDSNQVQVELISLSKSYKDLLNQQILITKVSDRLQKKLDKTNLALEDKNEQLQNYIEELTRTRIGRKATTITLIITVILFILTEGILEPIIDEYAKTEFQSYDFGNYKVNWVSLGVKGVLALLIMPIEKIVQGYLMRVARKKHEAEVAAYAKEGYYHEEE